METQVCSRCNTIKHKQEFEGYKQCKSCRASRREYQQNNKHITNPIKNARQKEIRASKSTFCEACNQKVLNVNWEEHFHWVRHKGSELHLLRDWFDKNFFKGKKTLEEMEEMRKDYYKRKQEIYDKLSEQFPNSSKWKEIIEYKPMDTSRLKISA